MNDVTIRTDHISLYYVGTDGVVYKLDDLYVMTSKKERAICAALCSLAVESLQKDRTKPLTL